MEKRIRLRVMGLSYNQLQSGAYALILAQIDGPVRIPVLIPPAEAQAIAARIEGVTPPRPMTHDLFVSMAQGFGVRLTDVFIYKFEDGIFMSELTFTDGSREIVLDARTGDAVAIAIRTGCPIYTTQEIVDQTGFILEEAPATPEDAERENNEHITLRTPRLDQYSLEELERTLERMIREERYEDAAKIKQLIHRKRNADNSDTK